MGPQAEPGLVSALVVLRGPAGPPGSEQTRAAASVPVTVENIAQLLPDPAAERTVSDWFTQQGFSVTAAYGTSMTIVGPADVFEQVFGAEGHAEGMFAPRTRLPVHRLPPEIAALVDAVGTPRQPDFGPLP